MQCMWRTGRARWPGERLSSCCAPPRSQPTETLPVWVNPGQQFHLSASPSPLPQYTPKSTHTCSFNTISPEPPLILRRISVHYGISPRLGGVRPDLLCPESVVFLRLDWRKRREERDGEWRSTVHASECRVTVLCVFLLTWTRVERVILACVHAHTMGSACRLINMQIIFTAL